MVTMMTKNDSEDLSFLSRFRVCEYVSSFYEGERE